MSPPQAISEYAETFLSGVEHFAKRRFRHRAELGVLVDALHTSGDLEAFEKLAFEAKFLTRAKSILERSGVSADETQQLSAEYRAMALRALGGLRSLAATIPEGEQKLFGPFLGPTHESLEKFMSLMAELSWIKNYLLDTKSQIRLS